MTVWWLVVAFLLGMAFGVFVVALMISGSGGDDEPEDH